MGHIYVQPPHKFKSGLELGEVLWYGLENLHKGLYDSCFQQVVTKEHLPNTILILI